MPIDALAPSGLTSPDGLAYDYKSKIDELLAAEESFGDLSAGEIAVLDSVTPGTSAASKAVVLDAQGTIDALDIDALSLGGVAVAATAPEIDEAAFTASLPASVAVAADALVIPVTHQLVLKTTGADAEALTLADGTAGQRLTIQLVVDGNGDGTLTPATSTTFGTIVFADAGDTAVLRYVDDTVGWIIEGLFGLAAQPAYTLPA